MPVLKSAKHEHFAQLVANGMLPPKAYVAVGYSEKGAAQSASRLLKDADVAARIDELREAVAVRGVEKAAVDRAWVTARLREVAERSMQAEPVTDRDGNSTGEYTFNAAGANRALELLGKELGMFVERKHVTTGPLDDLAADELQQLLQKLQKLDELEAGTARH